MDSEIGYIFFRLDKVTLNFKEERESTSIQANCKFNGPKSLGDFFRFSDGSEKNSTETEFMEAYVTLGEGDVSKEWAVDFGLSVRSKHLPLNQNTANLLIGSHFQVELLVQGDPNPIADFEVPLRHAMDGNTEWSSLFPLGSYEKPEPKEGEEQGEGSENVEAKEEDEDTSPGLLARGGSDSSAEVSLVCDNDFADFCVGSCVLEIPPGTEVACPPLGWQLKVPDETPPELIHEKVQEMLAGPQGKDQAFSLRFPANVEGADTYPMPLSSLSGAALLYKVVEREAPTTEALSDGEAKDEEGGKEDEEEAAPRTQGIYSLKWPSGTLVYLTRDSFRQFRALIRDENPTLPMILERRKVKAEPEEPVGKKGKKGKAIEDDGPLEPAWQTFVNVSLSAFKEKCGLLEKKLQCKIENLPEEISLPPEEETKGLELDDEVKVKRTEDIDASSPTIELMLKFDLAPVPEPPKVETTLTPHDIVPLKSVGPKPLPRDMEGELRTELGDVIMQTAEEYTAMFMLDNEEQEEPAPKELRQKQFMYGLTTSGVYHLFKERLKPRIQRVVRSRFQNRPDPAEQDRFLSDLYIFLMQEVNDILQRRVHEAEHTEISGSANPQQASEDEEGGAIQARVIEELDRVLALCHDAEAAADFTMSHQRHEDRVNAAAKFAEKDEAGVNLLKQAWFQYAEFCLRQNDSYAFDKAGQCLREALSLDDKDGDTLMLYGAFLMDQDQNEKAEVFLQAAIDLHLPAIPKGEVEHSNETMASQVPPRLHALLCLHHDRAGKGRRARDFLRYGVAALLHGGYTEVIEGVPRRTAVKLMQDASDYLLQYNLVTCAERALELGKASENLAVEKARERGLPTHSDRGTRERTLRLASRLQLAKHNIDAAENQAMAATELSTHSGLAWLCLGNAQYTAGKGAAACQSYTNALQLLDPARGKPTKVKLQTMRRGSGRPSRAEIGKAQRLTPLYLFLRLGTLYRQLSKLEESREVFLRSCQVWNSPSSWLGAGIACLRLNQLNDAEEALQQANLLDYRNGLIWGYLSLLSLMCGEERLEHANKSLEQALRFEIKDPMLLRELGVSYMAIDRLEVAENLLRQSLALDSNPRTRRVLADVNAAQNMGSIAVEDYKAVIFDPAVEEKEKQEAFTKCVELLKKLGREDEIEAIAI